MTITRREKKKRFSKLLDHSEPLVYICYCLIAGLYLFFIPWTLDWEQNVFFEWFGMLGRLGRHAALRGGVSGIGFVLICLGWIEFLSALRSLARK